MNWLVSITIYLGCLHQILIQFITSTWRLAVCRIWYFSPTDFTTVEQLTLLGCLSSCGWPELRWKFCNVRQRTTASNVAMHVVRVRDIYNWRDCTDKFGWRHWDDLTLPIGTGSYFVLFYCGLSIKYVQWMFRLMGCVFRTGFDSVWKQIELIHKFIVSL